MRIEDYYKEEAYIHYSNCHEDALFVLNNVKNSPKHILSVASALDNSLALLLLDPEEVLAIDSNKTQVYLCNLKKCGVKYLTYEQFLILLGIREGNSLKLFEEIKEYLDEETRGYFEERSYLIDDVKLVNCGRFEYYFSVFKNKVLPLIHSRETVEAFMRAKTQKEQNDFYRKKFNNVRFRLMFKIFFSETVMKRVGRDKKYFKYNRGSLADMLKGKFETGIYNNLNVNNPYLQYVVLNEFRSLPPYLIKENFEIIKQRIDRVKVKKSDFQTEIKSGEKYDFMYLSDIFEYMSEDTTRELSADIYDALNTGGQALLFNMMNERRLAPPLQEEKLNQENDRAFYYTACYSYLKD